MTSIVIGSVISIAIGKQDAAADDAAAAAAGMRARGS